MAMIKICGLREMEEIGALNRLKPDFAGFVFARSSARYISPQKAEELRKKLCTGIRSVGVFRDSTPEEIEYVTEHCHVDLVQLHGREGDDMIRRIQKKFRVIRGLAIERESDIRLAEKSPADYILLDHGAGGTGESFDWSLLQSCRRPFFLAGGLGPDNVAQAIQETGAAAVDASSLLETAGRKDPRKMEAFVREARTCRRKSRTYSRKEGTDGEESLVRENQ